MSTEANNSQKKSERPGSSFNKVKNKQGENTNAKPKENQRKQSWQSGPQGGQKDIDAERHPEEQNVDPNL